VPLARAAPPSSPSALEIHACATCAAGVAGMFALSPFVNPPVRSFTVTRSAALSNSAPCLNRASGRAHMSTSPAQRNASSRQS
jgi:hypothetical protein